jgi:cobalt/nickel transport system permease protein
MHMPDGFLSVLVSVAFWTLSIVGVGYALERVNKDLGERQAPIMGVLAAAIFAGQMLNFSVTGGTSGHLLGAALATIVRGPWAAVLVMTSVVGIQAVVFQDGGLLALGANIFNMGIVGVAVSYFVYKTVRHLLQQVAKDQVWITPVSGFVAAWGSIFVAALTCGLQLALSGSSPANLAVPAMGGIHALIGIGEGLITAGALAFILAARRDLLQPAAAPVGGHRVVWVGGLLIAVLLAVLSPLASAHPDGLEWVAEQRGFLDLAQAPFYEIIPDYALPGIGNEALATILAGVIGVGLVLVATLAVAYTRRRARSGEV